VLYINYSKKQRKVLDNKLLSLSLKALAVYFIILCELLYFVNITSRVWL